MRYADWQERLNAVIEAARFEPFKWGTNDCALFTCRCVDAVVEGATFEETVRDSLNYDSEETIMPVIFQAGGMEAITSQFFGPSVAPLLARPGDAVLLDNSERLILGIVNGHRAVTVSSGGIVVVSLGYALRAWKFD